MNLVNPSAKGPARPDLTAVTVLYRAVHRELEQLPCAVLEVPEGDHNAADAIADRMSVVVKTVATYHVCTHEIIWPRLRNRRPGDSPFLPDTPHRQIEIDRQGAELLRLVDDWRVGAGTQRGADVAAMADKLRSDLTDLLEDEQGTFLPAVQNYIEAREWRDVETIVCRHSTPRQLHGVQLDVLLLETSRRERLSILRRVPLRTAVHWLVRRGPALRSNGFEGRPTG